MRILLKLQDGFTRINVKIKGKEETEVNGNGPHVSEDELQLLYRKIDNLQDGDVLVLCGSIPKSLSNTLYEDIISKVAKKMQKL